MNIQKIRDFAQAILAELDGTELPPNYGGGTPDVTDPRQPNCRAHTTDANGLVTGVFVTVHKLPLARYQCVNVGLIDEVNAGGQHVAHVTVRNKAGNLVYTNVRLATGYGGSPDHFDAFLTAGNANNEFVIVNKFNPPALGPLAILIRNDDGSFASDVVASLGLPFGHHVSYAIEFQER